MYSRYEQNQYYAPDWLDPRRTFSRVGLALTAFLVTSYVIAFIAQIILVILFPTRPELLEDPIVLAVLNAVSMYVIAFPVYFIIVFRLERRKRMRLSIPLKEFLAFFFAAQLLMVIGSWIGEGISALFETYLGIEQSNDTIDLVTSWPTEIILISAVIVGPLFEELIFRKLMIDRLSIYGDKIAIFVSAIAFGLFHGNLFQFFYAMFLGLILGYLYVKTGKLRYTFLLHAIVNLFGSIVPLTVQKYLDELMLILESIAAGLPYDEGRYAICSAVSYGYAAFQYISLGIGAIVLLKSFRTVRIDPYRRVDIPAGTRFSTVCFNVGAMLYILASAAIFAMGILMV